MVEKILLQNVSDSKIHITWSDHEPASITVKGDTIETRDDVHLASILDNRVNVYNHIQGFFASNVHSVSDPFVLWNSRKAYIWGEKV